MYIYTIHTQKQRVREELRIVSCRVSDSSQKVLDGWLGVLIIARGHEDPALFTSTAGLTGVSSGAAALSGFRIESKIFFGFQVTPLWLFYPGEGRRSSSFEVDQILRYPYL